jgi:hypothetical protein
VSQEYPEDALQHYFDDWWTEDNSQDLLRGRLVSAFVPFVGQDPQELLPIGREEATEHESARYRLRALDVDSQPPPEDPLPVAAMPLRPGERRIVLRGKFRPALVYATAAEELPRCLRQRLVDWIKDRCCLVIPGFGVDADGSRAGWPEELVARIRRCEYPQFLWDQIPGASMSTVFRLDQLQPISMARSSYDCRRYRLVEGAMRLLDEWVVWHCTGYLAERSQLRAFRDEFLRDSPPTDATTGRK